VVNTNGFDYDKVYNALKNRVLWKSQGTASESNRYFENFHPLCDTTILDSIRPSDDGRTLAEYLADEQSSVVMECLNAVFNAPQIIDHTKLVFWRGDQILYPQPVPNQNQFVGLKVLMGKGDHAIKISSIELFFDSDVTFTMYYYNDMTLPPIYSKEVSAQAYNQVIVDTSDDIILNYLTPSTNKGGIVYIGYYQADLGSARALYYPISNSQFHTCWIWAYSAPVIAVDPQGNRNFQRNNIGSNNLTYGLNFEVSAYTDATNAIVQNKGLLDELIGNAMAVRNVTSIVYSYRTRSAPRNTQYSGKIDELYKELNGFKTDGDQSPYIMGLKDKMNRSIKTVKDGFQKQDGNTVGVS